MSTELARRRLDQTRWYFGVVGLFGLVAVGATLDSTGVPRSLQALMVVGAGLMVAYIVAAVGFPRWAKGPWLLRLAATMAVWSLALAVDVGLRSGASSVVPVLLFVSMPAATAAMRLDDARKSR